ncbi:MAG TPA: GIY-YIG nuclease family protein [Thermoanaerobaculia bacterium]|nr:GIY-YIG nuclease family protein [Thermoanaerobaculia bacterium]
MDKTTRRDLKRQYLESHRPTGVFRLRNTVDDRSWVSTSVNLQATFNKLRMQLDTGSFLMLPELQRDWKRLGADAFAFEVLEELEPPDAPEWDPRADLEALEALWLEQLAPYDERGYNRRPRALR